MIRIIYLLPLLCLIKCEVKCSDYSQLPKNKEECYNRTSIDKFHCCYINASGNISNISFTQSVCQEIPNTIDNKEIEPLIKGQVKEIYGNNITIDISCNEKFYRVTYLKKGFLLLLAFIL